MMVFENKLYTEQRKYTNVIIYSKLILQHKWIMYSNKYVLKTPVFFFNRL